MASRCLRLSVTTVLSTTLLMSVFAVQAADLEGMSASGFSWNGLYLGASVGAAQNYGHTDFEYGSTSLSDGDWTGGWDENGHYVGALYEDVDTTDLEASNNDYFDPDLLKAWVPSADSDAVGVTGSIYLGGQAQWDALVLGAEVRGTFSTFGTSYADQWSDAVVDSVSVYCNDSNPDSNCSTYLENDNNLNATWVGPNDGGTYDGQTTGGTATVRNDWELSASTSYYAMVSGLLRTGIALDRVMVYGTGGVSGAQVTANTDAHVLETGTMLAQDDYGAGINRVGRNEVTWSGENTEQLIGYSVGGGLEFAIADNMTIRGEALYTDLGTIDVLGESTDTNATYLVTQSVRNLQVSAGLVTLF